MTATGPCTFAGCGGAVEDGYCNVCGRAPTVVAPVAAASSAGSATSTTPIRMPKLHPSALQSTTGSGRVRRKDSGRTSSRRTSSRRIGLGLVDVPPVETGDPAEAIMDVAEVPEDKRYCSNCAKPVGRGRDGKPGRTEGFCPQCRTRFSFTPKLAPGDLLGGQYEVLGALAHGGLGWVYLARDKAVSDRWVVLKGLLDTSSEDAALAAVAERRYLAAISHSNVVEIYNFVTHLGAGYIVMEFVGGKSLKHILKERRDANAGQMDPLPVDEAMAYVLAVLPAMGYLHEKGLVYCDMKPDNVVLTGHSLKVIDLGGVRPLDDDESAIYGTVGYQAPEVAEVGPTVASDLYTVGRMVAVLTMDFRGYQDEHAHRLPTPDEQPLLAERESLHRFLLKATAVDPAARFGSAEEMAEQLLGVLREEAARRNEAQPAVSSIFGPDGVALGGGAANADDVPADWRLLPRPKVDPTDPGVGFLLSLPDDDPGSQLDTLTAAIDAKTVPASTEVLLRLASTHMELGNPQVAAQVLDAVDAAAADDWRLWWSRGMVALTMGKWVDAVDWLDPVYTELPGEVAPKLALALAHELAGELDRAAELYDSASATDPSYVFGAFGLARVRVKLDDRPGAVEALGRISRSSSAYDAAQVAAVRAQGAPSTTGGPPSPEMLARAGALLERLDLAADRHARLSLELFEAGVQALRAGALVGSTSVLGHRLRTDDLRHGMEGAYRSLARHASSRRERVALIDVANQVRPRTWL